MQFFCVEEYIIITFEQIGNMATLLIIPLEEHKSFCGQIIITIMEVFLQYVTVGLALKFNPVILKPRDGRRFLPSAEP